jgi:mono/diheme cytochrome c family protein
MLLTALLLMQSALPPQVQRGQAIFQDKANGCVSCHALKGEGTAVGPDLKAISQLSPRGIATAMRSTLTQYVQAVKPKKGEAFPAMPVAKPAQGVEYFDLSKTPPELRQFEKSDIDSVRNNETWKHPVGMRNYTPEQMADLIAYLRWAGTGDRKKVDPDEVK